MRTKQEIAESIKALDAMLDKMDYSTNGATAFSSGEIYGMRNVLCWVIGEDVANPKQIINQIKKQQGRIGKVSA